MNIREMTPDDIAFATDCVQREGWLSETRAVFETFHAHDRHGCFIAEHSGRPIGMIVATPYDNCGFLGELIVVPDFRGRGYGGQLMSRAIDYLHGRGCHSLYLDGDTPAVPLYERLGFTTVCRSLRFLGTIELAVHPYVRAMTTDDLATVLPLDREAFGADRSFFLRSKLEQCPHLCRVLTRDGNLSGYIFAQPGKEIVSVGPWWVDSAESRGLDLLASLDESCPHARLRIGVLETNSIVVERLRADERFEETECSWRMVMGADVHLGASPWLWSIGAPATG
jgi:GNAT superfamily N-acetyltransferase